jgi:hypothetical protein
MGQGFAPPANANLMQSANMLRMQPNTYRNLMESQQEGRVAQAQMNTPQFPQQMQQQMINPNQAMAQPFASSYSLNPYLPQNQQPLAGGLASLPGAAQFGKGVV